ncbi:MAG: transporter [Janthinobacterium lividum]
MEGEQLLHPSRRDGVPADGDRDDPSLRAGRITNGGLPSGSNFTTIQTDLGVSYLMNGWKAAVDAHCADPIDTSTDGPTYRFRSGAELAIDATLTKTIGKWTLGAGAHQTWQAQEKTLDGRDVAGSTGHIVGLGPFVDYQLGKVTVQAIWNESVSIENNVSGNFFQVRLIKAP